MSEHPTTVTRIVVQSRTVEGGADPNRRFTGNHAEAARSLGDGEYVAYCLREATRQLKAMLRKRWPDFEEIR